MFLKHLLPEAWKLLSLLETTDFCSSKFYPSSTQGGIVPNQPYLENSGWHIDVLHMLAWKKKYEDHRDQDSLKHTDV